MDKYSRVDLRLQEMGGINNGEMSINELAAFVNMLLGGRYSGYNIYIRI